MKTIIEIEHEEVEDYFNLDPILNKFTNSLNNNYINYKINSDDKTLQKKYGKGKKN